MNRLHWLPLLLLLTTLTAQAGDGALAVTAEPRDAEVWLDGELKARKTPVVLDIAPGEHTLELRKPGYNTETLQVHVPADGIIAERVTLRPTAGGGGGGRIRSVSGDYGYLRVKTTPPGMKLTLNGRDGGSTPIKRLKLDAGSYQVELSDPDGLYVPYQGQIEVKKYAVPKLEVIMNRGTARVLLLGDDEAFIGVDGRQLFGKKAPVLVEVPAGEPLIELTDGKKGFQARVAVRHGDVKELEYRLRDGFEVGFKLLPIPEMVEIPAGRFRMGRDTNRKGRPEHTVILTRSFAIGRYEVTFEEYDVFSEATGRTRPDDEGWGRGRRPVTNVSWYDAKAYTQWLRELTGHDYRLPTEAEWEYAARAGTTTRNWWGDQDPVCQRGVLNGAKFNDYDRCKGTGTEPVGSFRSNPWGLYDTNGNVFEWVEDWNTSYPSSPVADPVALSGGNERSTRGGAWWSGPWSSAASGSMKPSRSSSHVGFRVAMTP